MSGLTLSDVVAKYATPDPSIVSKLPKPTKRENQKANCNECGGYHGMPAVHLDFVGHADLTLILLDIDPEWTWEPCAIVDGAPVITRQDQRLVMWGYLTILGMKRLCVGTCEANKPDPEKELIGDLLRNGALRFGICTKLWSKTHAADPASSSPGGGYTPRQPAEDPERAEAVRVYEEIAGLPEASMAAFQTFKGKRKATVPALMDPEWRAEVERWMHEPAEAAS